MPAALGTIANYAINTGLVATAIGFSTGESIPARWRASFRWLLPHHLLLGGAATAAASAYDVLGVWGLAVFSLPVLTVRTSIAQRAQESGDELEPAA